MRRLHQFGAHVALHHLQRGRTEFLVDVGDEPVAVGDEAVLFGDPTLGVPSARDWADAADTIDYEIVTRIGPRVPRRSVS